MNEPKAYLEVELVDPDAWTDEERAARENDEKMAIIEQERMR